MLLPAAQTVVLHDDAPTADDVPAGQFEHPIDPAKLEYCPALQLEQVALPLMAANVFAGQLIHAAEPAGA
jgi:hypothetical protein